MPSTTTPTSISLSRSSPSFSAPSPAPSSQHDSDDHDDFETGLARKRARVSSSKDSNSTSSLSEQRKEARAHRNRIAAQNSRDRRKAQFTYLERRVAELEDENRRLRAGMSVAPAAPSIPPVSLQVPHVFDAATASLPLRLSAEDIQRSERERQQQKENEDLKVRIRTLEQGWDAVVKALASQGLAAGLLNKSASATTASSAPVSSTTFAAFPSPAPSHSSLELDMSSTTTISPSSVVSPSTPSQTLSLSPVQTASHSESTRHLAAGGLRFGASANGSPFSGAPIHQGTPIEGPSSDEINDKAMEALFHEILTSPRTQHATVVPVKGAAVSSGVTQVVSGECVIRVAGSGAGGVEEIKEERVNEENKDEQAVAEWAHEIEMQRMLDSMIMSINEGEEVVDPNFPSMDLGILDMRGEMGMDISTMGLELDMNLGMGIDTGVDFSGAGWGANVF